MNRAILFPLFVMFFVVSSIFAGTAATQNQKVLLMEPQTKIRGIVFVNNSTIDCELMLWDVSSPGSPVPIQDAKITMNGTTIPWYDSVYRGGALSATSVGTRVNLKIWLKKDKTFAPQLRPDYVLDQTVTNKMNLLFPSQKNNKINLYKDPTPTFRWSFTGATEKVCVFLETQNGQLLNSGEGCFTGLNYPVRQGLLSPNQNYILHIETCFKEMNFNRPPAPDSMVGFAQKIYTSFSTTVL